MQGPLIGSLQGGLRLVTHMDVCVLSPSQIYFCSAPHLLVCSCFATMVAHAYAHSATFPPHQAHARCNVNNG